MLSVCISFYLPFTFILIVSPLGETTSTESEVISVTLYWPMFLPSTIWIAPDIPSLNKATLCLPSVWMWVNSKKPILLLAEFWVAASLFGSSLSVFFLERWTWILE